MSELDLLGRSLDKDWTADRADTVWQGVVARSSAPQRGMPPRPRTRSWARPRILLAAAAVAAAVVVTGLPGAGDGDLAWATTPRASNQADREEALRACAATIAPLVMEEYGPPRVVLLDLRGGAGVAVISGPSEMGSTWSTSCMLRVDRKPWEENKPPAASTGTSTPSGFPVNTQILTPEPESRHFLEVRDVSRVHFASGPAMGVQMGAVGPAVTRVTFTPAGGGPVVDATVEAGNFALWTPYDMNLDGDFHAYDASGRLVSHVRTQMLSRSPSPSTSTPPSDDVSPSPSPSDNTRPSPATSTPPSDDVSPSPSPSNNTSPSPSPTATP